MSNIFGFRTRGELVEENNNLRERVVVLEEKLTQVEINARVVQANHLNEVSGIKTYHGIEITNKDNEIHKLKENFKTNVEREVAQERKALRVLSEKQEKEHTDRMKRLETDYASKIAKCDRDLEADKASYRKYLRQEHNTEIETLKKQNKEMVAELNRLKGENEAFESVNSTLNGVVESSNALMTKLVGALPQITAEFTTPDVSAPNVTVGSGNKS